MKPWQNMFVVDRVSNFKVLGDGGGIYVRFGVFFKGSNERPNTRWYSTEKDAQRGAAQIYNQIEKTLLK